MSGAKDMRARMREQSSFSAVRALCMAFGAWSGVSGIEHGFFEILQGNVPPVTHIISGKPMIYAIGEADRMWRYGYEYAITIVPSYSWTGVLAAVSGLLVLVCSLAFIQKRLGWLAFILLSTMQYLVGGGYAQFAPALIIGLLATRIRKPFSWRRIPAPIGLLRAMALPWLPLLVALGFVCLNGTATAVTGWFYGVMSDEKVLKAQWSLLYILFGLFPLTAISALSRDSLSAVERREGKGEGLSLQLH